MDIHTHALEFARVIGGNVYVNLISTDYDQVKNTIFWTFPNIMEVAIGSSTYFSQNGQIYNATIDYNSKRVIMVKERSC